MPTASINGLAHYFVDEGVGEPLVLLHGAASSGESLKDNYVALSEKFRVIVPDLRGMGSSAHVHELPPGGWVDDLFGLLDRKTLAHTQHGDDWEQVMNNFLAIRNDAHLQEYYNLRDLCENVESRVLIMRGDVDDSVHPLRHSFELHSKIGDSTLAIVPACPSGVGRGNPKLMRSLISEFVFGKS